MYTICVDLDCVLNNLTERVIEMYNQNSNKNIQLTDITSYNFYDCLPREDADGIVKLFQEKDLWDSLTPIKDSQWGIEKLIRSGYKLIFATATDPCNFEWKMQWLKDYFPFINPDDVIRIMDKSFIKCDILIDDCLDQLTRNLCERICLSYPWNISEEKDYVYDIKRADNWKDILRLIDEIERGENNGSDFIYN